MSGCEEKTSENEPLAIVGMACRLPGAISSPSDLWQTLIEGRSCRGEVPSSRFSSDTFYHPDPQHPGSINSLEGFFIDQDPHEFDNDFFGINNLEAKYMDPQQRQLLEVTFECLESAGISLSQVSGTEIGCWIANFTMDYTIMQSKDPDLYHRYSGIGMGMAILANRISHALNLKGPSMTIDTACSSSLYALHAACAALRGRECDGAIVGGANLILSPEMYIAAVKAGMTSGTSTCHTFDSAADGYARAEGVGALYIKRLTDAIRDGDLVRSVIRGIAVNSNGRTNGISLPSVPGQAAVIRRAYANANLDTQNTDYVEAHGTGTEVGDGIEVEAFSRIIQHGSARPTLIGGIKPTLGHGEAVSGISSIIKVSLALERKLIPATIGVNHINPKLQAERRNVNIVTQNTPWPQSDLPRASINSFGYGGSNGHVVLEAAREQNAVKQYWVEPEDRTGPLLMPLSAASRDALDARFRDLSQTTLAKDALTHLAYTLSCRRSHLPYRSFAILPHGFQITELPQERRRTTLLQNALERPRFLSVFTGQGSQWTEMGAGLIREFPLFSEIISHLSDEVAADPHAPSWDLRECVTQAACKISVNAATVSQPACTAIQIALVELLKRLHVEPRIVVGHSSGEIAAAYTAGYITANQAIKIAYYRGLVVSKYAPKGAMAAFGTDQQTALEMIKECKHADGLEIACINSPKSVTISGEVRAIEELVGMAEKRGCFVRELKTDNKAYHSRHMQSLASAYRNLLTTIFNDKETSKAQSPCKMFSSVYGREVESSEVASPDYWAKNLESRVQFSQALSLAAASSHSGVIEIGPHQALKPACRDVYESIGKNDIAYYSAMTRGKDSAITILELVGSLFLDGYETPIETLNAGTSRQGLDWCFLQQRKHLADLPNYRWHRGKILWNEARASMEYRKRKHSRHDLIGTQIPGHHSRNLTWRNLLKVEDVPWLRDHKLEETIVFPAAGYLAMAIEMFSQANPDMLTESASIAFRSVKFINVLALPDSNTGTEVLSELAPVQNSMVSPSGTLFGFTISSYKDGTCTIHARGLLASKSDLVWLPSLLRTRNMKAESQDAEQWYSTMRDRGLNFGPRFQLLKEIVLDSADHLTETSANLIISSETKEDLACSTYLLHPQYLDALLQCSILSSAAGIKSRLRGRVPVSIKSISISSRIKHNNIKSVQASSTVDGLYGIITESEMKDNDGKTVAQIEACRFVPWRRQNALEENTKSRAPIMEMEWKPDISAVRSGRPGWISQYLSDFEHEPGHTSKDASASDVMATLVDLYCHKALGVLKVLEIKSCEDFRKRSIFTTLDLKPKERLKRAKDCYVGTIWDDNTLQIAPFKGGEGAIEASENFETETKISVDLIVASFSMASLGAHVETLASYLAPKGILIIYDEGKTRDIDLSGLRLTTEYTIPHGPNGSILVLRQSDAKLTSGVQKSAHKSIIVLYRQSNDLQQPFHDFFVEQLSQRSKCDIKKLQLQDLQASSLSLGCLVISILELGTSLLSNMSPQELKSLQTLCDNASTLIWLQSADSLKGLNPDMSLTRGVLRSMAVERPSLKFFLLDVGYFEDSETMDHGFSNLEFIMQEISYKDNMDTEYTQLDGVLHISRYSSAKGMNDKFNSRLNATLKTATLGDVGRMRLSVKDAARLETICWEPTGNPPALGAGTVEIQAKAFSINAKDYYALRGLVSTRDATCSLECSGIVTQVGSAVTVVRVGDRVVSMVPNKFETILRVPDWSCYKLEESQNFVTLASIPMVFSTALYALHYRAQIKSGESVLIHSAAGGVGIAAIQIAKLAGAQIFATVGTDEKKEYLVKKHGLQADRIFSSRDASFHSAIMKYTNGLGVDIVLNSLTGDLLRAGWHTCSEFGRFVDLSKNDSVEGGHLPMDPFSRSATYHAFDLTDLYYSRGERQRRIWTDLLRQSLQLLQSGAIQPVEPLQLFDVSKIQEAFQAFGSASRIGKIVISLEESSILRCLQPKYSTSFDPDGVYLLIGCLGGLGRCLSKWMIQRGARHLVFLGRSGASKPAAQESIEIFRQMGANVQVFKADVTKLSDVQSAVARIDIPIKGVIHAAMNLDEGLFTSQMTTEKWFNCVNPKIRGAWNLHQATLDLASSLDFFLMTSSVAGIIGLATESNYCAANSFLDHFARYRHNLGLPALSIGLGLVTGIGYVSENPKIEEMLLRKGITAYNEEELLQIIDISLSMKQDRSTSRTFVGADLLGTAHIFTGLELEGAQAAMGRGLNIYNNIFNDPRAGLLTRALEASEEAATFAEQAHKGSVHLAKDRFTKAHATALSGSEESIANLNHAAEQLVVEVCSNLLLLPKDSLKSMSPVGDIGVDSMVAAELRTALFEVFKVDTPLVSLLDPKSTLGSIADRIVKKVLKSS